MIAYWQRDCEWMGDGLQLAICPSFTGSTGLAALDVSGRSNHGILTNFDRNTAWKESAGKLSLECDGINDHVVANMPVGIPSITFSGWFNFPQLANNVVYAQRPGAPVETFYVNTSATGRLGFLVSSSLNGSDYEFFRTIAEPAITLNRWLHIVFSWNGKANTQRIFVDGVALSSFTSTNRTNFLIGSGTTPLWIGRLVNGYSSFQFDDLRMYDRVLTAPEVGQMYEQGRGGGMLYQPPRRRSYFIAPVSGWKSYWIRPSSKIIGAGI
jgi:hypothetical protein